LGVRYRREVQWKAREQRVRSGFWRFCCPGERAVQTSVIKDPGCLAHNAVDPRLRVRAGKRIQHHRPDPGQSQFAGQHQPVWAGPGDDDLNHGASLVVDIGITRTIVVGATRNECRHHATAHKDLRREGRGHRTSRVTGTLRGGLCASDDGESGCCLRCQSLSLVEG
jgi:hypothetical protein